MEWAPWDVTAPNCTRIEVKASGYLQSWGQLKLSTPVFRVAAAYGWDAVTGTWSSQQGFNADVYVFCLQTATCHEEYDPLQVSQWQFYVAPRHAIEARAGARMGLGALERLCGQSVTYPLLGGAILLAAESARER